VAINPQHAAPSRPEAVAQRVPKALLDAIIARLDPRRVVLFGSAARGEAGPDSDLDLLVVMDDDAPAERLGWRALWEARRGYSGPVDLVASRESALRERAKAIGSFAHTILAEGTVGYERE
jgi:predicted nucleotidyltransferase